MIEFVELGTKMYSLRTEKNHIKKSKSVKKWHLTNNCMYTFRTYRHEIFTQKTAKVVLSPSDTKE